MLTTHSIDGRPTLAPTKARPKLVDEKYYEAAPESSIAQRLVIAARDRILIDFMARMRPSPDDTLLDVGVSDVINAAANGLERAYPYPHNITACGLGDASAFKEAFPEVRYVSIEPNARLPFDDAHFAIATSNAVLEHVGSFENQLFFIKELCRVASRVFVTVPNRFFPIEHHTAIPAAHYDDSLFKVACWMSGKSKWAREENLILMTRKLLWRLAGRTNRNAAVGYTGLLFGPFSSNLYLALH